MVRRAARRRLLTVDALDEAAVDATLADVGNVAVLAVSDHARSITATAINITSGTAAR